MVLGVLTLDPVTGLNLRPIAALMAATACVFATACASMQTPSGASQTAETPPAQPPPRASLGELTKQVEAAERGFAQSMAARDFKTFTTFIADEAIFFGDADKVLRGKAQVLEVWKGYFEKPAAPFSWSPERVEVLESGTLALSTGPVFDGEGKKFAAFNSIWRLEPDGHWRVIFDKGSPICEP